MELRQWRWLSANLEREPGILRAEQNRVWHIRPVGYHAHANWYPGAVCIPLLSKEVFC